MNDNNTSTVRANVSKYIVEYLDKTKTSKAALGKKLGVTATSINRWIDCVCAPDIDLLSKISEVINVSVLDLLGIGSEPELTPEGIKLIKEYTTNSSFKNLVDRYLSDESFKNSIDYIVNLKN